MHQKWPNRIFPIVNFVFPTMVIWGGGGGGQLVRCGTATFAPAAPAPGPSLRIQFSSSGWWPVACLHCPSVPVPATLAGVRAVGSGLGGGRVVQATDRRHFQTVPNGPIRFQRFPQVSRPRKRWFATAPNRPPPPSPTVVGRPDVSLLRPLRISPQDRRTWPPTCAPYSGGTPARVRGVSSLTRPRVIPGLAVGGWQDIEATIPRHECCTKRGQPRTGDADRARGASQCKAGAVLRSGGYNQITVSWAKVKAEPLVGFPGSSHRPKTFPNGSKRFQTVPNGSKRFQMLGKHMFPTVSKRSHSCPTVSAGFQAPEAMICNCFQPSPTVSTGLQPLKLRQAGGAGGWCGAVQSLKHYETPVNRYETPVNRYETPVNRYETPVNRYETPVNRYETPVNRYETPVNRYETPLNRYETPLNRYETPMRRRETATKHREGRARCRRNAGGRPRNAGGHMYFCPS